jgi:thiamine-monophosphate kinase
MKELNYLQIINNTLDSTEYLGDDCANLDNLGIFVTQDTLVENVHFSMHSTTPYLLGRKAVNVNLSDLAAALSKPAYITISLSLPSNIKDSFVEELYKGINEVCNEHNVKVIGGDITGSNIIVISITAIGIKTSNFVSSRSFAKKNDYVVVTGNFGASSAGLYSFSNFLQAPENLKTAHLNPTAKLKESKIISKLINSNIAAMDCSDGLIDALYKIAQASKHSIKIDFDNVPVLKDVIEFSSQNKIDYKKFVLWGGEDYELVFCINEEIYKKLDKDLFKCIGRVQNKDTNPYVTIKSGQTEEKITKEIFEKNSFNHFEL